jgi:pyruvate formate lyase activating enzyme
MTGADSRGVVFNIMRFAVHDGPGIRTTVFLKGCPLECWWCHNPEGQAYRPQPFSSSGRCRRCGDCIAACPQHAIEPAAGTPRTDPARCTRCGTCVDACWAGAREICGREMGVGELIPEIQRDSVFFDDSSGGVTLSGGEPISQPRFVAAVLRACRERRIHTTVETCGYADPRIFQAVAREADLLLFDLKLLDGARHRQYTGVSNGRILKNLEWLASSGRPYGVRIPVVPGVNDTDGEAEELARYLSAIRAPAVDLLPYHRAGNGKYGRAGLPYRLDVCQPVPGRLDRFAEPLRAAGLNVRIGG